MEKKGISIGFAGAGRGVGVTHLCILAAHYCNRKWGAKTAVLMMNRHGEALFGQKRKMGPGIYFYRFSKANEDFTSEDFASKKVKSETFDFIFLDVGEELSGQQEFLQHCDKRILVGSSCMWKRELFFQTIHAMEQIEEERGYWRYLLNFADRPENIPGHKTKRLYTMGFQPVNRPLTKKSDAVLADILF